MVYYCLTPSNVICPVTVPASVPRSLGADAEWRVTDAPHGRKRSHRLLLPKATNHGNNDNHNHNHKNVGWFRHWVYPNLYPSYCEMRSKIGVYILYIRRQPQPFVKHRKDSEPFHALRTTLQLAALQPPFHPPTFSPEKTDVRLWCFALWSFQDVTSHETHETHERKW